MFWRDAATSRVRSGEDALLTLHGVFPEQNIWNGNFFRTASLIASKM
jgi:hypothetical protein